jgi:hypothetical protein
MLQKNEIKNAVKQQQINYKNNQLFKNILADESDC